MTPSDKNALEVFRTHDGSHAGSAESVAEIHDDVRVENADFPCRTDHGRPCLLFSCVFFEPFCGLADFAAPDFGSVPDFHPIVTDQQVNGATCPALDHQAVPAGSSQFRTEQPSDLRLPIGAGKRRSRPRAHSPGSNQPVPCKKTCRKDQPVLRTKGVRMRRKFSEQGRDDHPSPPKKALVVRFSGLFHRNLPGTQVHPYDLSRITEVIHAFVSMKSVQADFIHRPFGASSRTLLE